MQELAIPKAFQFDAQTSAMQELPQVGAEEDDLSRLSDFYVERLVAMKATRHGKLVLGSWREETERERESKRELALSTKP